MTLNEVYYVWTAVRHRPKRPSPDIFAGIICIIAGIISYIPAYFINGVECLLTAGLRTGVWSRGCPVLRNVNILPRISFLFCFQRWANPIVYLIAFTVDPIVELSFFTHSFLFFPRV